VFQISNFNSLDGFNFQLGFSFKLDHVCIVQYFTIFKYLLIDTFLGYLCVCMVQYVIGANVCYLLVDVSVTTSHFCHFLKFF
jgi:hypothetical protein